MQQKRTINACTVKALTELNTEDGDCGLNEPLLNCISTPLQCIHVRLPAKKLHAVLFKTHVNAPQFFKLGSSKIHLFFLHMFS